MDRLCHYIVLFTVLLTVYGLCLNDCLYMEVVLNCCSAFLNGTVVLFLCNEIQLNVMCNINYCLSILIAITMNIH